MTSLSLICDYGSDSSDEDDEVIMEVEDKTKPKSLLQFFDRDIVSIVESLISRVERRHQHHHQNHNSHQYSFSTSKYRSPHIDGDESDDTSSDSGSDTSVWSAFSDDEDDFEDFDEGNKSFNLNSKQKPKHCVTKGELTLEDLPPIERLQISVDIRCLTQVGIVSSMINQLVVIQSFKSVPVLDLDTVLFCKEGTSIGQIFDVIGPVKQPNYVLRFNSAEEAVVDCKLELNAPIYYAEGAQQPITRYVFVQQLERERGCDASWKHNNEPPPEEVDFSDDEAERRKKKAKKRPR